MPIEIPKSGLTPGASAVVERYVGTNIKAESWIARGWYWVAVLVALLVVAWAGLIVNQAAHTGNWNEGLLYTAIVLAIASIVYFLGWGWRWLWSGRTDHLFGRKKFATPGRLEDGRQKITAVFSLTP
jgi:hypothetical protein